MISANDNQNVVRCEQAIFTSVSGATAEGYRIVSAGLGIRNDEKMEITRLCPSHGGLCSQHYQAKGIFSSSLSSGRQCIGFSRYAGEEHTGRGGQRVYTHVVLIDRDTFRKINYDAVSLCNALGNFVGDYPDLSPPAKLDPIELNLSESLYLSTTSFPIDGIIDTIHRIFLKKRVIACTSDTSLKIADCLLGSIPLWIKQNFSFSAGLKFAMGRKIQLAMVDQQTTDIERAIRGQPIDLINLDTLKSNLSSPYQPWIENVRKWFYQGQFKQIRQLNQLLVSPMGGDDLQRIASLHNDIEDIVDADEISLSALVQKYSRFRPRNQAETTLLEKFNRQTKIQADYLERKKTPVAAH